MKELKTQTEHYYLNDKGQKHGEYKDYHDNGQLFRHCYHVNGQQSYYKNGQLFRHCYYNNGDEVHDFLKNPVTDIQKHMLYLKYQAPLLDNQS